MMVKRKKYFQHPISRQNFANAFAETPNLNLEVRLILGEIQRNGEILIKEIISATKGFWVAFT